MAEILKGYAREQLYFKREQEADLFQHYKKLVKTGKLPRKIPEPLPGQSIHHTPKETEAATKVLFEILQQSSRLNDPNAHKRKDLRIRGKATPPPLPSRIQSQVEGVFSPGEVVGQLKNSFDPKFFSMQRGWSPTEMADSLLLAKDTADLHAVEVGQRQFAAAFRVMTYATAFSIIGFGAIITIGAYTTGISNTKEFNQKSQVAGKWISQSLRKSQG
eukprot:TRINITY_DN7657_c0_g3_i4.p1 TRINITY_DN7657_c0_g3~~TRINITY_DN7657_c0_g3_i4.p1  ORF type:complete len:251 (+),score=35.23 TRINITY_DN7657_c0_g3_i4:105-755(+)